jgi:hypothetical protein
MITVTHGLPVKRTPDAKMGVNARNFEPAAIAKARIRHFDGATSWKYVDRRLDDGRLLLVRQPRVHG